MKEKSGIVAENVMRDSNLSLYARGVYGYIASMAEDSNECCLSLETIAKDMNMSKGRIAECIVQLINAGIITEERTRNGNLNEHNVYRITDGLQEVREDKERWTIC